jgi:hypothetical protein
MRNDLRPAVYQKVTVVSSSHIIRSTPPMPTRSLHTSLLVYASINLDLPLVASCLRGALPPADLRAVCLVRAMVIAVSNLLMREHRNMHTTRESQLARVSSIMP